MFLSDLIIELFFEVFIDGFLSLCSAFIPNKVLSQRREMIIRIICCIVAFLLLVGLFVGTIVLFETHGESFWGWLLVSLCAIYVITAIVLKIISCFKK